MIFRDVREALLTNKYFIEQLVNKFVEGDTCNVFTRASSIPAEQQQRAMDCHIESWQSLETRILTFCVKVAPR